MRAIARVKWLLRKIARIMLFTVSPYDGGESSVERLMALIECRECKAQISDAAKACPHCGVPSQHTAARGRWMKIFAGVIVLAGVVWGGAWLVQGGQDIRQCQDAMAAARSAGALPAGENLPRISPVHRFGPPGRMTCIAAAAGDLYQLTYDVGAASGVQLMAVVRASDGAVQYSTIGR